MAYLIPKKVLAPWIGEGSKQNLPRYLVLSRLREDFYCVEPLLMWLSRHARSKRNNNPVLHSLSTVSSPNNHPIRDNGVNGHGISL